MGNDEIWQLPLLGCGRRSLRSWSGASASLVSVRRRGLEDAVEVEYSVNTNINNLGMTSTEEAYEEMTASLNEAIASGDFTTMLVAEGEELGTTSLMTATVEDPAVMSNYTAVEVTPSSGTSSEDNSNQDDAGIIAGSVIGGVALVAIFAAVGYFFYKPKNLESIFVEKSSNAERSSSSSSMTSHRTTITAEAASPSGIGTRGSITEEVHDIVNPIFQPSQKKAQTAGPVKDTKVTDTYDGL